jgi:hypothetical protein
MSAHFSIEKILTMPTQKVSYHISFHLTAKRALIKEKINEFIEIIDYKEENWEKKKSIFYLKNIMTTEHDGHSGLRRSVLEMCTALLLLLVLVIALISLDLLKPLTKSHHTSMAPHAGTHNGANHEHGGVDEEPVGGAGNHGHIDEVAAAMRTTAMAGDSKQNRSGEAVKGAKNADARQLQTVLFLNIFQIFIKFFDFFFL